jgi:multidrug efflux pump subunit AcrA (membrane-fusion protein)
MTNKRSIINKKRWIMKQKKSLLLLILASILLITGCSQEEPAVTPILTAPASTSAPAQSSSSGSSVSASGLVLPAKQANLSLALPAQIASIAVEEGQHVLEDELLIQLAGQAELEAAVAAAQANLLIAQQALSDLKESADLALAQAKVDYAIALEALDQAQREWTVNQPGNRASPSALKDAKADVVIAEKLLSTARENLNKASGTTAKAQAQSVLRDAEIAYNQAVWLVDWLQSEPTELEQARLDADLAFAEAMLAEAEKTLARLGDGPDPDALALAEVQVESASKGLSAAQARLVDAQIRAPFEGTVTTILVETGETAFPGQIILSLANLDQFQVETIDLSERDIDQIEVGGSALIFLEALGEEIEGTIIHISQQSTTIGGDVVYPVTISSDAWPENTRWGMSVEVEFSSR